MADLYKIKLTPALKRKKQISLLVKLLGVIVFSLFSIGMMIFAFLDAPIWAALIVIALLGMLLYYATSVLGRETLAQYRQLQSGYGFLLKGRIERIISKRQPNNSPNMYFQVAGEQFDANGIDHLFSEDEEVLVYMTSDREPYDSFLIEKADRWDPSLVIQQYGPFENYKLRS